jgi:K+-sensing histidine kinase KdpD
MLKKPFAHRLLLVRTAKVVAFSAAILIVTRLMTELGAFANSSTTAFLFIIIVILSAFFGDFVVAVITSIVAALCFDYFFLLPIGTFNIASFSDWISLVSFLFASIVISYFTSATANNRQETKVLTNSMTQAAKFGEWLLSLPSDRLTLSDIAREALELFSLEYCSIHVYGEGKWRHFSGGAISDFSQELDKRLKILEDHPTDIMELAGDPMSGVRFRRMDTGTGLLALLAVKSDTLPDDAMGLLAYMIAVKLTAIVKNGD